MATDEKTSKFAHNAERSRAWFDVEEDKEPSWTEKHLMPIIENISNKEGWLVMAVLTLFCVIFYWLLIKYKGVFDWRAFPGWRGWRKWPITILGMLAHFWPFFMLALWKHWLMEISLRNRRARAFMVTLWITLFGSVIFLFVYILVTDLLIKTVVCFLLANTILFFWGYLITQRKFFNLDWERYNRKKHGSGWKDRYKGKYWFDEHKGKDYNGRFV
jgi:hypothetical protein